MRWARLARLVVVGTTALTACAGPEPTPAVAEEPPVRNVEATPGSAPAPAELPRFDLPLSVEEAYAAIPHRRTRFRFESAPLPAAERRYLEAMFHLIDQGTRVRVVAWRDLYHRDVTPHDPLGRLSELIRHVEAIEPPDRLAAYHGQVRTALVQQRAFFQDWLGRGSVFESRSGGALARHPAVGASSRALQAAYGILMRELGPGLAEQERQAFFDHHCALDFL